jgi:four helix bundle protein
MAFKFEKLIVWQKAIDLTGIVHDVTLTFPKDELYILSSQIKRAADSVALNIAEGSTSQTKPEFNRFLGMALRSDIEVVSCIYIARKRKIISNEKFDLIYNACQEILAMLNGLKQSLTKPKINEYPK